MIHLVNSFHQRGIYFKALDLGKHIGRPKGLDAENLTKVKKAVEQELSVAETVELTGISLSSVKR